jgi:hypothetical protein
MKRPRPLLCVLVLLLLALAVPVHAEPSVLEPIIGSETLKVAETLVTQETFLSSATAITLPPLAVDETQTDARSGAFFFADGQLSSFMSCIAVGLSLLALLFSVIALVRSGKKSGANVAGDYKKYF